MTSGRMDDARHLWNTDIMAEEMAEKKDGIIVVQMTMEKNI